MIYILLVVAVMTLSIIIGVKLAFLLLAIGCFVVLFGIAAAGTAAISASRKCTDERSPLAEAIWESNDND